MSELIKRNYLKTRDMSDALFNYLNKRLQEDYSEDSEIIKEPGPVVTISRQSGCSARSLTENLVKRLNEQFKHNHNFKKWDYVNKELLEKSARELKVKPSEIKYVFKYMERNTLGDIFASYASKYYKSDRLIRKTIGDVIKSLATDGNIIIVGRAGVALTKDFIKSLHIGLVAPFDYRSKMIMNRYNLTISDARKSVNEMDKAREKFRASFVARNNEPDMFDVVFNRKTIPENEIIDKIISLMISRGLI